MSYLYFAVYITTSTGESVDWSYCTKIVNGIMKCLFVKLVFVIGQQEIGRGVVKEVRVHTCAPLFTCVLEWVLISQVTGVFVSTSCFHSNIIFPYCFHASVWFKLRIWGIELHVVNIFILCWSWAYDSWAYQIMKHRNTIHK